MDKEFLLLIILIALIASASMLKSDWSPVIWESKKPKLPITEPKQKVGKEEKPVEVEQFTATAEFISAENDESDDIIEGVQLLGDGVAGREINDIPGKLHTVKVGNGSFFDPAISDQVYEIYKQFRRDRDPDKAHAKIKKHVEGKFGNHKLHYKYFIIALTYITPHGDLDQELRNFVENTKTISVELD